MPNDITNNPLVLDTASANAITVASFSATKIRWVNATTASHTVSVQNNAGIVKFGAVATGANYTESEHFDPPLKFEGLKMPTLASGTIYIYVSSKIPIE